MASLRFSDLIDILIQRAERLGLVDAESKKADSAELELYLFQALLPLQNWPTFQPTLCRME